MKKIEDTLMAHEALGDPKKREELKQLLTQLRGEISDLSKTHSAQAQVIVGKAEKLASDVAGNNLSQEKKEAGVLGLSKAVEQFEQSHPRLVQLVGALSKYLSDIGI